MAESATGGGVSEELDGDGCSPTFYLARWPCLIEEEQEVLSWVTQAETSCPAI